MLPRALPPSEHTILSIAKGDRTSLQLQVGGAVLLPCIVTRTEMTLRGLRVERNSIWFWNRWFGAGDSFEPVIYSSQWFVRASDLFESVICFQWFVCFQKEPIPSGRRKSSDYLLTVILSRAGETLVKPWLTGEKRLIRSVDLFVKETELESVNHDWNANET